MKCNVPGRITTVPNQRYNCVPDTDFPEFGRSGSALTILCLEAGDCPQILGFGSPVLDWSIGRSLSTRNVLWSKIKLLGSPYDSYGVPGHLLGAHSLPTHNLRLDSELSSDHGLAYRRRKFFAFLPLFTVWKPLSEVKTLVNPTSGGSSEMGGKILGL